METARFSRELYAYFIFLYFDFETILVLLCRFESYFRSMNVNFTFLVADGVVDQAFCAVFESSRSIFALQTWLGSFLNLRCALRRL